MTGGFWKTRFINGCHWGELSPPNQWSDMGNELILTYFLWAHLVETINKNHIVEPKLREMEVFFSSEHPRFFEAQHMYPAIHHIHSTKDI